MTDPDPSDSKPEVTDPAAIAPSAAPGPTPQAGDSGENSRQQPPSEKPAAAGGQSTEQALIAQRRSKVEALRAAGQDPFPNDAAAGERSFIGDLRRRYAPALSDPAAGNERYEQAAFEELSDNKTVTVFGRLMARRGFGKLSFLKVRDATGDLQLFARRNVLGEPFEDLSQLDVGDHLEAKGPVILTKSGELSVDLQEFRLLGKALRPLPEKWHGLTDVEQRYRRRYVDLVANPQVAHTLRARASVTQGLRDYLDRQRFVEVETPTLHTLVGGAIARPFSTRHNAMDLPLYLRIAPELYLKRLLVGGLERVYEIGRCYRNEGISTRHNPEFTMLELYQAYATYETLVDLGEDMLRHVDGFLHQSFERLGLGQVAETWRDSRTFTLDEPFVRLTMRDAIAEGLQRAAVAEPLLPELEAARFDLSAFAKRTTPLSSLSARAGEIDWKNLNKALSKAESPGERTFVAYEYVAEPFLATDYRSSDGTRSRPVFITEHPTDVSPLAKRKQGAPHLTERFELFIDSMEVGNAFSELNDPDDQAARFQAQVERKSRGQEETMDYDADYVRALEHGMPPAAGFGLGIDRLTMQFTGQHSIRDVIAFPLLRPETSV